ncbi:MAG TPA: FixH family protein, partial [Burkholderiales bacterium]|nr:FixH family protein [Burkholderiales bacterium]
PWFLMTGPVAVVIASAATLWLAVASNDGLVADDYYKRGLAINQTLSRERRAAAAGYRAQVAFSPRFDRMRVVLSGSAMPVALTVRFAHPTRAGLDQLVRLPAMAPGIYEGSLAVPQPGSWRLIVQDDAGTWRLHGECIVPTQSSMTLQAQ